MSNPKTALVVGGSLIGLLAGNLLHRRGWDVRICERAKEDLEGRGAGITILPGLINAFRAAGAQVSEDSLGIKLLSRAALNRSGDIVAQRDFVQYMTSWGRLYESLRSVFPAQRYLRGVALERIEQDAQKATACFVDGTRLSADLIVGADGFRSSIRAQLLPALKPHYCGYVAWRCLTDESELPADQFAEMFERYTVGVTPGEQCIGYPVPGLGHATAPGQRQFNVVWYHPIREADELVNLMTDNSGHHHAQGIPPALLSTRVRDEMIGIAQHTLAPQFALALKRGRWHFFQPIYDLAPQRLAFGRVFLAGDAAFVIRPHVAMGVPKGAGDVIDLVHALEESDEVPTALRLAEAKRLRVGQAILDRGRYLGAYMEAQLQSDAIRRDAEATRIPEQVMMETAAPLDYEAMALQRN